jgi:anti-sigma factor RsiW
MAQKLNNCREVGLRIQSYLDDELDSERMAQIREHLEMCVDCGVEADVFRQIKVDLANEAPATDDAALERLRQFSQNIAQISLTET